jgi:hypothetical protein
MITKQKIEARITELTNEASKKAQEAAQAAYDQTIQPYLLLINELRRLLAEDSPEVPLQS